MDYTDQEGELRRDIHPHGPLFGTLAHQEEFPRPDRTIPIDPSCPDPLLRETRVILDKLADDPELKFLRDHTPHLSAFASSCVMRDLRSGITNAGNPVRRALLTASEQGIPTLQAEAASVLQSDPRTGATTTALPDDQRVVFSASRLIGCSAGTSVTFRNKSWDIYDLCDTIPYVADDTISVTYGKTTPDKNKCLSIHRAAATLCLPCPRGGSKSASGLSTPEILSLEARFRREQQTKALACGGSLGDPTPNGPLVVAELRSHVHDVVSINHDMNHRTLLCFPLEFTSAANRCIGRVSLSRRYSIHLINSVFPSNAWIYLIAYQEHMRMVQCTDPALCPSMRSNHKTAANHSGWEALLSFCAPHISIDSRNLSRWPHFQSTNVRLPLGVEGALVGCAMILDDSQLRPFHIKKPWAEALANEQGPTALESWSYESTTPPIDDHPTLSADADNALADLLDIIPPEDSPFDFGMWGEIAELTGGYVGKTGDLFGAAHAYMTKWRLARQPTTIQPAGLKVFDGIVEDELLQYSLRAATHGEAPHGGRAPVRFRQDAYSNINDNPQETAAELWEDVLKGRLMLFTVRSEPFTGNLMESKLAYATQRDATDPERTKTRYISDPRNEVNERIDNDNRPQCVIPRHQNVARMVLYWKLRYPTIPILIWKRDVKGAFKLIPISIRGLAYTGFRFSIYIAMYLALFFGWRPSPANWGLIATLLMQYVTAYRPQREFRDGAESFIAYQYVGDVAFIEPWIGLLPWLDVSLWERALTSCLDAKALRREKRDVEGNASTRLALWGVTICTRSETFSPPEEKIDRAREFLATIDYDHGVARIELKRLQELRVELEHWSVCDASVAFGDPHVGRLLRFKGVFPAPQGSLRQIKQAYLDFWDSLEYIRAQMSTGSYNAQSHTGSSHRVLSLDELLSLPQSQDKLVWLGSGATLTQCSAIDHNDNISCIFTYYFSLQYMSQLTGLPDTDFALIALSEFLWFLCFLIVHSGGYRGKLIAYAGDNQNVAKWIKHRRPKKPYFPVFCRILNRLEVDFQFTVFPCYVNSPTQRDLR